MSDNLTASLSVGVIHSGDGSGLTDEQERQLNKIPTIEQSVEEIINDLNSKANTSDIPTNTSELNNDSGFLTSIPSEYVTETEMNEAIANVSSGGSVSQEDISTAVNNYLTEHPITGGATAEQANQIEANKTNIATLKELVGDSSSGLVKAVTDNALQLDTNTKYLNNIGFNFIQQGGVEGEYGDNRHVLQLLINTLNTMGGGTIFIPEGTYYFERNPTNPDYCIKLLSNVSISGAGRGRTILKCGENEDTSLYSLFWNCEKNNIKTNMKFEDFTVDMTDMANETTPYSHKGKAFYIQSNTNSVYRDLELVGTPSTALGIDFLNNVTIDNVDCDTCGRLWVFDYTNSEGIKYEGPGGAGIGIGTGLLPIENVKVVNCTCRKCGHFGIFFEHQAIFGTGNGTELSKGVIIANNIVTDGRCYGIGIRGGYNYTVSGNQVYGCARDGIFLNSGESGWEANNGHLLDLVNINVTGNTCTDNGFNGITIDGSSKVNGLKISGNLVSRNIKYGIALGDRNVKTHSRNNISVNGNTVVGNGSDIYVDEAFVNSTRLSNNDINKNTYSTGKIKLGGNGLSVNKNVCYFSPYIIENIITMKLPQNIAETKCIYSLRDTTYKTDNKVVGYSINVTADYKLEISTCTDNGTTLVKYTSTEVLQSGVKLALKIQKRDLSYVFSVTYDGETYTALTFDDTNENIYPVLKSISAHAKIEAEPNLYIGKEWAGSLGWTKSFTNLVIYQIFGKRLDESKFNFIFNKPGRLKSYEDNDGGYEQIITYLHDVAYLNEPVENGVIPLYY